MDSLSKQPNWTTEFQWPNIDSSKQVKFFCSNFAIKNKLQTTCKTISESIFIAFSNQGFEKALGSLDLKQEVHHFCLDKKGVWLEFNFSQVCDSYWIADSNKGWDMSSDHHSRYSPIFERNTAYVQNILIPMTSWVFRNYGQTKLL